MKALWASLINTAGAIFLHHARPLHKSYAQQRNLLVTISLCLLSNLSHTHEGSYLSWKASLATTFCFILVNNYRRIRNMCAIICRIPAAHSPVWPVASTGPTYFHVYYGWLFKPNSLRGVNMCDILASLANKVSLKFFNNFVTPLSASGCDLYELHWTEFARCRADEKMSVRFWPVRHT